MKVVINNVRSVGAGLLGLGLALAFGACVSPPVEAPQTTVEQQTSVATEQNLKDEVDLLFMVDDSGSMQPKQTQLRMDFPQLIEVLDTFAAAGNPANYHIGVVTSDLGAAGVSCGFNLGGKLQAVGAAAPAGCQGPAGGAHYIVYNQKDHTQDNLPSGQTLAQTFTCMATGTSPLGDNTHIGCGFESQLESVYKALHDPINENQGFLRPEAILAVVWVTDEDDCSADPTTDLFSNMSMYGNQASYKCTRFGITCDGQFPLPATPVSSFASCQSATPAQGSKLTDIQKYINFYTKPSTQGGVKANPRDVVLAAITAPATPFGTEGSTDVAQCGQGVSSCTILSHSCIAPDDPKFFGDPSVRIHQVIGAAQNNQITSICDHSTYKTALQGIGAKIVSALRPSCLSTPIADLANPDCTVEDDTLDMATGTITPTSIPQCDAAHSVKPCWAINPMVTDCPQVCNPKDCKYQKVGVDIDRGKDGSGKANPAPANTTASVNCATIAIANQDPNLACTAPLASTCPP